MEHHGATSQATGSLHLFDPTPDNPHVYQIQDPSAADIENASNKDTYPRVFNAVGHMMAWLTYTKHYRPQSQFWKHNNTLVFVGNRNPKFQVPRFEFLKRDTGMRVFKEWWCKLPNTIPERKYIHAQMRDVISALALNDIPLALSLLDDINLAVGETAVADHVKLDLVKALEAAMFPEMWDYMDPETRPAIPYTPPKAPSNSGTQSGTSISGTTSVTVTTHGGATT